jgi:hypothetical protein
MALFAIPNPKKTLTVNFDISKVADSIQAIPSLEKTYKLTKGNEAFNIYTLEAAEFLSLGIFADFSLNEIAEGKTEITLELRRKIGSFDESYEVSKANQHIDTLMDLLSKAIVMGPDDLAKLKEKSLAESKELQKIANKPWYMFTFLLVVATLIFFPIGVYGIYKRITHKD